MEFFEFLDRLNQSGRNLVDTAIDFRLFNATKDDDRLSAGFVDRQLSRFGVLTDAAGGSQPGTATNFVDPQPLTPTLVVLGGIAAIGLGVLVWAVNR